MIKNVLTRVPRLFLVFLMCAAFGSALAAQETAAADDIEALVEQTSRLEQLALSRLRGGSGIGDDTAERFSEIVKALDEFQQRQSGQGAAVSLDEVESLMDQIAELRLEMRNSSGSRTVSGNKERTVAGNQERPLSRNQARRAAREANKGATTSSGRSSEPTPEKAEPTATAVPAAPIVVPAKTKLTIQLRSWLSSKEAKKGEIFYARVDEDVTDLQDRVLIPERSVFEGQVVEAKGAGMFGSAGKLVLRLDKLMGPDGQTIPAAARVVGLSRGSDIAGRSNGNVGGLAGEVAGESVEGNLLDKGDPKKTAVTGGVDLALGKGTDVFLRAGTKLLVELNQEVAIPWQWPEASDSRRRRRR